MHGDRSRSSSEAFLMRPDGEARRPLRSVSSPFISAPGVLADRREDRVVSRPRGPSLITPAAAKNSPPGCGRRRREGGAETGAKS
ncbi:hypothetical protein SKAU_G00252390 [Synaphobranchus kaupii]|uniref:Uncharacterized protein n=1 Tax=Synaphobranchus kaupii TaxID=118154 RepID=A0A9Q1F337_SYNKA|nr:hypothetical protein SKAU_G00252390 [Synaphobranchus kaupii]